MAGFDIESLKPVVEGGFLKGLARADLEVGHKVELQAGSMVTLCTAVERHCELHVLSVNWSKDLIRSTLASHLSKLSPLGTVEKELGLSSSHLHSPDLIFKNGLSTGALSGPPSTSIDKLEIMRALREQSPGTSVYVGDSVTDLLALLEADVGIVVGTSATLMKVALAYNVQLRPLVGALASPSRTKGVLYTAASWYDITLALYGA